MTLYMALIPICNDCGSRLESAMFEIEDVEIQGASVSVHLDYCPKCDEYKGHNKNFAVEQEKQAVLEKFNHIFRKLHPTLEDIAYKTIIPIKRKS